MTSDSTGSTFSDARLEQFRSRGPRQKIHPIEQTLLWVVALQLSFLPWALGGTRLWAQWVSLGLSIVAFTVSLLPREYQDVAPGQAPFRLFTWPKLVRFPIFWLGLLFLGYIATQNLNPAWQYESNLKGAWWMHKIPHTQWLPSGVKAPFEKWGPWRIFVVYASIFFTVCATWIGFTRRRSIQTLFTVLAANAFLLALLGIAERATHAEKIYWFWSPPAAYFVSSFIYKNHAGAYFNLMLALCLGLVMWHHERGLRRFDKSTPSGLFAFFSTAIALIVVFSYSRTATILMLVLLSIAVGIYLWRRNSSSNRDRPGLLLPMLVLTALGAFIFLSTYALKTDDLVSKVTQLKNQLQVNGLGDRATVTEATWEMFNDRPWLGWGSGSFRFLFTLYQKNHSSILYINNGQRLYYEHAHNDYVELPAEWGLVGLAMMVSMIAYLIYCFFRGAGWQNAISLFIVLGCTLVAMHSAVDFHAANPAILTTFCVLFVSGVRWAEIDRG